MKSDGKVIELTGKPDDTNSLAEPKKIVPVGCQLSGLSETFEYTFPQNSITLLVLNPI